MNGYILESKSILDSAIWKKPPLYFKVWHYLLLNAQYSDYGNLKRGQLFTSIPKIQEACSYYVGYRKETPTKRQIYDILNWLRNPCEGNANGTDEGEAKDAMIVTTKVTHGIVVTICNYNVYQNPHTYESNNSGNDEEDANVTTKRTRKVNKRNNIKKENKRINENEKNYYYYTPVNNDNSLEVDYFTERAIDRPSSYDEFVSKMKTYMES